MTDPKGNNQMAESSSRDDASARDAAVGEAEREMRRGMSMLAKVTLAVVVLVSLIICITCVMQFNRLEEEKARLEAQLQTNNEMIAELQYWQSHPVDEQYIEEFAKRYGYNHAEAEMLLKIIHDLDTSGD